jgi:recombination protein RecA
MTVPPKSPSIGNTKAASLAAFSAQMHSRYGGYRIANESPPVIVPTGSANLDKALRVGGWREGRVFEVIGPKDSGKSSLVIASIVSFMRLFPDRGACYVNIEGTFDPARATEMGLDCSDEAIRSGRWAPLLPASTEEASDMARDYCASGFYGILVVDSVGGMESWKVLEKSASEDTMGKNAQVITKMTKHLSSLARLHRCTVLLVNQQRANFSAYGGPQSAGPMAMQYSTTAKVEMSMRGAEGDVRKLKLPGDEEPSAVSQRHVARVTRAKNTLPGRSAQFFINKVGTPQYGPPGIDVSDEYLTMGTAQGVIKLGGAWYTFPDGERANGRDKGAAYLREHPDVMSQIREALDFDAPADELEGADDAG